MARFSKRVIQDAIAVIDDALASDRVFQWIPDDADVRRLITMATWSDDVRWDLRESDAKRRLSARLAIAENLLREGWLP